MSRVARARSPRRSSMAIPPLIAKGPVVGTDDPCQGAGDHHRRDPQVEASDGLAGAFLPVGD